MCKSKNDLKYTYKLDIHSTKSSSHKRYPFLGPMVDKNLNLSARRTEIYSYGQ